jgi:hypothetical protein
MTDDTDNVTVIPFGFQTAADDLAERQTATLLAAAWKCDIHLFGPFNPIDGYAARNGRMMGLVEIKCRSHTSTAYHTVYLSMRKHFSMSLASTLYCVPSYFVVRFADNKIGWLTLDDVDPRYMIIAGHADPRAPNDREPVIEVPLVMMRWIPINA